MLRRQWLEKEDAKEAVVEEEDAKVAVEEVTVGAVEVVEEAAMGAVEATEEAVKVEDIVAKEAVVGTGAGKVVAMGSAMVAVAVRGVMTMEDTGEAEGAHLASLMAGNSPKALALLSMEIPPCALHSVHTLKPCMASTDTAFDNNIQLHQTLLSLLESLQRRSSTKMAMFSAPVLAPGAMSALHHQVAQSQQSDFQLHQISNVMMSTPPKHQQLFIHGKRNHCISHERKGHGGSKVKGNPRQCKGT